MLRLPTGYTHCSFVFPPISLRFLLAGVPHDSRLAAQVDKLKRTNYAEVSELEKQQLRELLQEKQQRDAQRGKRKP